MMATKGIIMRSKFGTLRFNIWARKPHKLPCLSTVKIINKQFFHYVCIAFYSLHSRSLQHLAQLSSKLIQNGQGKSKTQRSLGWAVFIVRLDTRTSTIVSIYLVFVASSRICKNCEVVGHVTRGDVCHGSSWMEYLHLFSSFGMVRTAFIQKHRH